MRKLLLAALVTSALAGCGSREPASPAANAQQAPAPGAGAPAPGATNPKKQASTTPQETGGADDSPGDAALERMAPMPESAQLPGGRWKAGVNYQPVVPAQPTSAEPGQVEVVEVLWLGCPHCYELEPYIEAWRKTAPPYVKFVQEHIMWGPAHRAHARLFYTLEVLGHDDLVPKAFDEIHRRGNMLITNDDAQTMQLQLTFARANGISEADFKREYNGSAVNTRLQHAEELMRRYQIEGVPLVIVNGKYQTDVGMAGGHEQLIALINDLAAAEKGR